MAIGGIAIVLVSDRDSNPADTRRDLPFLPDVAAGPEHALTWAGIPVDLSSDLRAPATRGPAYRMPSAALDAEALISALGLGEAGRTVATDGGLLLVESGTNRLLHIAPEPGAPWSLYRGDPACAARTDAGVSSDGRIFCSAEPMVDLHPSGVLPLGPDAGSLPDATAAEAVARRVADATGNEVLRVAVAEAEGGWTATVESAVDGLPAIGLDTHVLVGRGGLVISGRGFAARPSGAGTYPLIDARRSLGRLQRSAQDRAEEFDPVEDELPPPRVTAMRLALALEGTGTGAARARYLLPAFVLDTDAGTSFFVPAVADEYLVRSSG